MQCSSIKPTEKNGDLSFLGEAPTQWKEGSSQPITYASKEKTIFLSGGMTLLQDSLVEAALQSLGITFVSLPNPDFKAFQTGKAFGNRGQCNPTYFTVGNLVKYLQELRDTQGLSSQEIVQNYAYITAGGCGPCRFGMYITEYKKALRDAGFEGFRLTSFDHEKGIFQGDTNNTPLLDYTPKFFIRLLKAVIIGDILNLLGYKLRPYEVTQGTTDKALVLCKTLLCDAFLSHTSLLKALWKCREILGNITLNRLQVKPKVMVMGEFWAAMTEGDGNYNLYRFLEAQGAECIPQPILNRLMLSIWEAQQANTQTHDLQQTNANPIEFTSMKTKTMLALAKVTVKTHFTLYAKAVGLHDYSIPDMDALALRAKTFYTLECSGGEGHLEVAHLLESIEHNLAHLVISVKPFGCMPSSAVSDGIQPRITHTYPQANFLSIETSGEGAANFYSRVQMALFKAKQSAKEEYATLDVPSILPSKLNNYLYQPRNDKAGTAATLIESLNA